jgi:DNA-binding phage protein
MAKAEDIWSKSAEEEQALLTDYWEKRKSLTKEKNADIRVNMALEKILRDLVKERGLRKTARDLGVDSGSLCRSLKDGSNLKLDRIEQLLDYFGYALKIVKRKEVKRDIKGRLSQGGNPNRR